MKAVDVVTEIIILVNRNKVAEFSANPDNAPVWYVNIKSVVWKTSKPRPPARAGTDGDDSVGRAWAVGSQIAFVAYFLGRKLSYVYEIREVISNEKLVMSTADGPYPMETTYTWEAIDEHTTRMTLRNRGKPSGFSKLFAPLMAFMMRRANKKDLKLLKQILESKKQ